MSSSSPLADELAAQSKSLHELQRQLDLARVEGQRLKHEADSADVQEEEEDTPQVVTPPAAPSMAELFALAESKDQIAPKARCYACQLDPYSLRSQLVTCACGSVAHVGCVGLRPIPFKGASRADLHNRDLYIRRYLGDWRCANCERNKVEVAPVDVCVVCEAPHDTAQLLICTACRHTYHTFCLGLRRIPFADDKPIDRAHRNRFVSRHFADWHCPSCADGKAAPVSREKLAADLAAARATIARQAETLDKLRTLLLRDAPALSCSRCRQLGDLLGTLPEEACVSH